MTPDLTALKKCLDEQPEVAAAYLFGSAAQGASVSNDVDVLVLLRPDTDKNEAYFDLTLRLAEALGISEQRLDLLFLDLEEAEPAVLCRGVNEGILLKNADPGFLGDRIEDFRAGR